MSKLHVESFNSNSFAEQCYVVWDEESRHCLIVDPGFFSVHDWYRCHQYLVQHQLQPKQVLITHSHTDHVSGTGIVANEYPGIAICGSADDQFRLPSVAMQNRLFGVMEESHWTPITRRIAAGEELTLGQHRIQVIDCPGHSFHGLCYFFPDDALLFSGDVLFCYSIGRSDFGTEMGCDGPQLVRGIVAQLLTLPAEVVVYPGHGPATTIGAEAKYNPYLH